MYLVTLVDHSDSYGKRGDLSALDWKRVALEWIKSASIQESVETSSKIPV
jgi:hypothetical protein